MPQLVVAPVVEWTPATLRELGEVFELYRAHYGEAPSQAKTAAWIADAASSGRLTFFAARYDKRLVGLATTHETPASLRLGHFWQLRDLFVRQDARRLGIARTLLHFVVRAAAEAGALRLSLQTELTNTAALRLYQDAGFTTVGGLETLTLEMTATSPAAS